MGTLPRDAVLEISYTPGEKETSRRCVCPPPAPFADATSLLKLDLSIKPLAIEECDDG